MTGSGRASCARPLYVDWAQQASLSVGHLSEPIVLRTALEALTFRLDGSRAAANTITWQIPRSSAALDPVVVANPAQVSALLDMVARIKPEMTASFGCLYYAALRPEEAVALRFADCHLP